MTGGAVREQELVLSGDKYNFDYAHFLDWHPGGCASLHGHSSTLVVRIYGVVDEQKAWVLDFGDVKAAVQRAIDQVDHRMFVHEKHCSFLEDTVQVSWSGVYGAFEVTLPRERVVPLAMDSTAENLSLYMAELIAAELPAPVSKIQVELNEGIGKVAIAVTPWQSVSHD